MINSKNKLFTILIFLVLLALISTSLRLCPIPPKTKIELVFWGLWDDSDVYESFIRDYEKLNPEVKIKYYKKTYQDYEKDLLDALASGKGPDIFTVHHTEIPQYLDKISPLPQELMTVNSFQNLFMDVASFDLIKQNQIYAVPFSIDTLALFYNKDLLYSANISQPPKTWEEFKDYVEKITRYDEAGNIIHSAAAIGTAENVNRSTDMLALLMLQSGVRMVNEDKSEAICDHVVYPSSGKPFSPGKISLKFYTDFANPTKRVYTWNPRMHYSIDAFYEQLTTMMFNYSYNIETIYSKARYLNFGISEMPQIEESPSKVNYANYWAQTVSLRSKYPFQAWDFLLFIATGPKGSPGDNLKTYLKNTYRPTARRDLVNWQKENYPSLEVFVNQALTARSWYQVDSKGIEEIFVKMVEDVVLGKATIEQATKRGAAEVTVLMQKAKK